MLKMSGKPFASLRAVFLAGLIASLPLVTDIAQAGPGRGGGGAPHGGGGGGFHGGGGGGHGGGGGFRGGGGFHGGGGSGMHVGGGPRGGGFHAMRAAPGGRSGINGGRVHSGPARNVVSGNAHGRPPHGNIGGTHAPSGLATGIHAGPNHPSAGHGVANRMTQHHASAVGHALASHQVRSALQTRGGLRNPMARAAITGAVAGAAFAHHRGGLWWRHPHGGYGWVGPVFWPYAYNDFYDYAWWGGDYDPYFWDYGYSDLYAGLFSPYDYDALNGYAGYLPETTGSTQPHAARRGSGATTTLAEMCGSDSASVAGFPVEQFRSAIQPTPEQANALDDLAKASQQAADTIRNACPRDVALTAPSRMAAMQLRVQAMRDGITSVKPALDNFYGRLSDDQKAKITALAAAKEKPARRTTRAENSSADNASCSAAPAGATDWPREVIERDVKPTDAQRASLTALQDATTRAADILKTSCPPTEARTPPARLDAAAARLDAMLQAIGTVRPALEDFYGALSDEQKAAFDAIGPARTGPATASAGDAGDAPQRPHRRRHGVGPGMVFRMLGM